MPSPTLKPTQSSYISVPWDSSDGGGEGVKEVVGLPMPLLEKK